MHGPQREPGHSRQRVSQQSRRQSPPWPYSRPDGIVYTASGAVAKQGVTIAADWDVLPPGTVVYIDGLGERVVQDRGGAIKGNAVDIYFEDHDEALVFGRQAVRLYIIEERREQS